MICKERNPGEHPEHDKFSAAGTKAEEQMAFYLKRAFDDNPEVWVFNDLRFRSDEDDVTQVDHLVMHRSGFIVIESKSVTSKVRIHENGEWERLWNNHWQGMASPIKQVERQVKFLRKALQAYREQLLGKMLLGQIQMGFSHVPFEMLVAISDTGSIDRKGDFPEVSKADLITDRVRDIVKRHKRARTFFGINNLNINCDDGTFNFKAVEIEAMRRWFIEHHYPQTLKHEQAAQMQPVIPTQSSLSTKQTSPSTPTPAAGLGKCDKCGTQSEILWGHNYYWKCPACQATMAIKEYCQTCKERMKLRKDKKRFYKYCETCKSSEVLYYEGK